MNLKDSSMYLLYNLFLFILIDIIQAEWNTKDFMKREHSLIKPYYGNF